MKYGKELIFTGIMPFYTFMCVSVVKSIKTQNINGKPKVEYGVVQNLNIIAETNNIDTLIKPIKRSKSFTFKKNTKSTAYISELKQSVNVDTLAYYICTQSKHDTIDINCMVQVVLNRYEAYNKRGYYKRHGKGIFNMLKSCTSKGSGTVRRHYGISRGCKSQKPKRNRYWFTKLGSQSIPRIKREIEKVMRGEVYFNMTNVTNFDNHQTKFERDPDYIRVHATSRHYYYVTKKHYHKFKKENYLK